MTKKHHTPLKMMSQISEVFVGSILMGSWEAANFLHSFVPDDEGFRVLAVLDRADLRDFACYLANNADDADGPQPFLSATIQTVLTGKLAPRPAAPKVPKNDLRLQQFNKRLATFELWATDYLHSVVIGKNTPLGFSSDLTSTLPVNDGAKPPGLTEDDYQDAADTLDVEVEAIKAVSQVESGRGGFEDGQHPTIRYELHQFNSRTNSVYLHTHPWLAQTKWDQGKIYHEFGQTGEYSMLYNAMILGRPRFKIEEALASASWGRFQVMGFNHKAVGWPKLLDFVTDMYKNEGNQLKAFVGYIKSVKLEAALQTHDWEGFAAKYNGAGQVEQYGANMKKAYERFVAQRPKTPSKQQESSVPTK